MNVNLIVPVSKNEENKFPYLFNFNREGILLCINSILGLEIFKFNHIYFVVLKKHDKMFNIKTLLEMQFERLNLRNAKVVLLEEPTKNEPETVYRAILQEKISGASFIKDADCYFKCEIPIQNGLCVTSIENYNPVLNLKNKSFVRIDDSYFITNIIEKKIIGKYISVGGYFFNDTSEFMPYFERFRNEDGLYLSHIIYAMLLDKKFFRPIEVEDYEDWDTTCL